MAAPNAQAVGTLVHGTTGAVSVAWPTHASGDIAFLIVESAGSRNITLSTPAGFVPLTYGLGTVQATSGTRLTIWWCRATSSSMASPAVTPAADHSDAVIVTVRGAIADGDPVEAFAYTNKSSASTSVTWPAVTTVTNDCLILNIGTRDNDAAGAALSSSANASLASVAEGADDGTTDGNGGGIFTVSGTLATAGSSGTTTATVTSSQNMLVTLAIRSQAATGIYMRQRSFSNIYTSGATVALPANTLPGSLIVIDVSQYNVDPALSEYSDSQGNTYQAVRAAINDGDVDHLYMMYAKNTIGGSYTLTFTGNSVGATVFVTEYVGADTTSPLDQVGFTASGSGTTYTASVTTTTDNELYHVIATDAADDFVIFTPATNYKAGIQQGDITNYMRLAQADRVTTQGTVSGGFTVTTGYPYALIIASFKPGAAVGTNNGFFNFF